MTKEEGVYEAQQQSKAATYDDSLDTAWTTLPPPHQYNSKNIIWQGLLQIAHDKEKMRRPNESRGLAVVDRKHLSIKH